MTHSELLPFLTVPDIHLVGVASDRCDGALNMHVLYFMVICLVDERHVAKRLKHVLLDIYPGRDI